MKKILLGLSAITALAFTACGGSSDNGSGDKKVEISYAIWAMEQEPAEKELIKRFEEQNPNIKVKLEVTPWDQYWTKLEAAATGGVAPDVFSMGQESQLKYMEAGIAQPLSKYIEKDNIDMNNYVESVRSAYELNGEMYAMPRDIDSIALAYNKALFDKAGVAYPTNDWTWEDLERTGKIITEKLNGVHAVAFEIDGQNSYYNLIPQSNGFVISKDGKTSGYNNPETVEGIKKMSDLIKDGLMPSAEELSDMDTISLFQSNKIAMFYSGSWNVKDFSENKELDGKVGFVVMPLIKKRIAVSNGIGLMMASNSKHKDAAWKLMKFLTSEESQKYLATSGTVIPAYKSVEHFWADGFNDKVDVSAFITELEYSYSLPTSRDAAKWRDIEGETLKQVWAGNMSPEDACKEIYKVMTEALKAEQE